MQLSFEHIRPNLEQIQLFMEQKQKEVRINCNKLERKTYFVGGEEKKSYPLHLAERVTSCGEVNFGLKFIFPQLS